MNIHKEIHLEEEICEHLAANGWHYVFGESAGYLISGLSSQQGPGG